MKKLREEEKKSETDCGVFCFALREQMDGIYWS